MVGDWTRITIWSFGLNPKGRAASPRQFRWVNIAIERIVCAGNSLTSGADYLLRMAISKEALYHQNSYNPSDSSAGLTLKLQLIYIYKKTRKITAAVWDYISWCTNRDLNDLRIVTFNKIIEKLRDVQFSMD
jgi:hypothetical protein